MKPSIRVDGRSPTCHQLLSRRSRRPHAEGTGTQLFGAQQRSRTSHEPSEGDLSQLGIPCAGKQVYAPGHRAEWLAKITEVGVFRRAEFYYQQLDALRVLHQ